MQDHYHFPLAFKNSIKVELSCRRIVRIVDFQRELAQLNPALTLLEANVNMKIKSLPTENYMINCELMMRRSGDEVNRRVCVLDSCSQILASQVMVRMAS